MKLLVATNFVEIENSVQECLARSAINRQDICFVTTIDELLQEMKTDQYHFIITEYCIDGTDIWQIAKLTNSTQFLAHSLPIFLIKESCETDIPPILAKECSFQVIALDEIGETLKAVHSNHQNTGYRRGRINAPKNKLLIIDDDEDAAFFAYHSLKDLYDIDIANDGLSGYRLWESKRHELILLDLMLPVMMGDLVLEKIMEIDKNQPVIIITGHDKPNNHRDLLLNGASEYLCKPYSLDDLKGQCQVILNRAKLIYQADYLRNKIDTLSNLFWLLDQSLSHNDTENCERIMTAIKTLVPNILSDDQKLSLLKDYSN